MFGVFVQLNEDSQKAKSNPVGYIIQENGCWDWVGGNNGRGYGTYIPRINGIRARQNKVYAHRWVYEQARGPIPPGLVIDHLCRNPGCVNPDHLEAVTQRENTCRGELPTAKTFRTGICSRGHHIRGKNVVQRSSGARQCRECLRLSWRRKAERRQVMKKVVRVTEVPDAPEYNDRVLYDLECGHQVRRRPRGWQFQSIRCPVCPVPKEWRKR